MKISSFAVLSLFALASGSVARRGNRFGANDDNDSIPERSRVTAFVNTDEGLKVECWEIGDFLPDSYVTRADGSKGTVRRKKFAGDISMTLFSFAPSVTIFSFGTSAVHSNAIDFRAKPNLFTVKDGLIFIEALAVSGDSLATTKPEQEQFVFADINGDDWFYFEDDTSTSSREHCAETETESHFNVRTISGSETTLINFQYQSTPHHKVLHEGRCNFAGLRPVSPSGRSNSNRFRYQQEV